MITSPSIKLQFGKKVANLFTSSCVLSNNPGGQSCINPHCSYSCRYELHSGPLLLISANVGRVLRRLQINGVLQTDSMGLPSNLSPSTESNSMLCNSSIDVSESLFVIEILPFMVFRLSKPDRSDR